MTKLVGWFFSFVLLSAGLVGCGGGGGGGSDSNASDGSDGSTSYTVSVNPVTHGKISPTTQTVRAGEVASFAIEPDLGYALTSIEGCDGSMTGGTYSTVPVGTDCSIKATFDVIQFKLTYSVSPGGAISGETLQSVAYGSDGSIVTAVPAEGYHFVSWSDGFTSNQRTDTNVTSDVAVTANFAPYTYTLTYTAGSGGSIDGSTTQTVDYGTDGSAVTAAPDTGFHFVNWSDGSTDNPRTDLNVTGDIAVGASFASDTYVLSYTAGGGGSITGTSPQTINSGADGSSVTAAAETGYYFVDWSDGSTSNPRTDTNVTSDIAVTANFSLKQEWAPDLLVSLNSVSYSGYELTVSYAVYNGGLTESAWVNLGFWLDADPAPSAGDVADGEVFIPAIQAGGSFSGDWVANVGALDYGTVYAYVDAAQALTEANENNNVSGGRPWSAPVQVPSSFDFEDALRPPQLFDTGDAGWSIVSEGAGGSYYSIRSDAAGVNQDACIEVSVDGAETLSFDWKVLRETAEDELYLYVNGNLQPAYLATEIWKPESFTFSQSFNTVKWCYSKGSIDDANINGVGWVDNIRFQPKLPELSVIIDAVVVEGSNLAISYTVSNSSAAEASGPVVDFWANSESVPTVGPAGDVRLSLPSIAGKSSFSGVATVPTSLSRGVAYGVVDPSDAIAEQDESNNVSSGKSWDARGTPLAVYDFENGVFPADLRPFGDAGWQIDSVQKSSGNYGIRSAPIGDGQGSCFSLTVSGSSQIVFDWFVSSETGGDFLRFHIDNVQQNWIAGTYSSWRQTGATVPVGTHRYSWCYIKDSSGVAGLDAGFIDNIRVY